MAAMKRRGMDRAQRMRAQRAWWARNGAFMRGMMLGIALMAAAGWLARTLAQSGS
jgi:hypothetical protein